MIIEIRIMKKAFTIVELVIVLSIVAILSAVLVPQLINVAEKSKDEIIDIYNGKTVRMVDYQTGEILYEGKNAITLDGYTLVDVKNDGNVVVMYMERQRSENYK